MSPPLHGVPSMHFLVREGVKNPQRKKGQVEFSVATVQFRRPPKRINSLVVRSHIKSKLRAAFTSSPNPSPISNAASLSINRLAEHLRHHQPHCDTTAQRATRPQTAISSTSSLYRHHGPIHEQRHYPELASKAYLYRKGAGRHLRKGQPSHMQQKQYPSSSH